MSEAPEPARETTPWGLVVLLGSLTAMGPVAIDMYLRSLPAIGADRGALSGLAGPWVVLPLLLLVLASYRFMQGDTTAGALNVDPRRAGSALSLHRLALPARTAA